MMIRWWEHGVCDRRMDGQTDGQTENTICRAAWSQLKKKSAILPELSASRPQIQFEFTDGFEMMHKA